MAIIKEENLDPVWTRLYEESGKVLHPWKVS